MKSILRTAPGDPLVEERAGGPEKNVEQPVTGEVSMYRPHTVLFTRYLVCSPKMGQLG